MIDESVIYEVWGDIESGIGTLITTPENIKHMKDHGLIDEFEGPLYSIRASSWTEAMTYHHEHNGWEPYKPFQ